MKIGWNALDSWIAQSLTIFIDYFFFVVVAVQLKIRYSTFKWKYKTKREMRMNWEKTSLTHQNQPVAGIVVSL